MKNLKFLFKPFLALMAMTLSVGIVSAQQRDTRVREYLSPKRIVWMNAAEQIQGSEHLLREGTGQTDLTNKYICRMTSTQEALPSILLDFGEELHGGLQIVTGMPGDHTPIRVRVRFGESVSEAMSEVGEKGATNDHAMRDMEIQLPWLGVAEIGNSGYRFVRIDMLDADRDLHLKEVRAISIYRDIEYRGEFKSSDERLNKIWQVGARTVHLNMQEYLWDGIKRDRLVWIGDMHPEVTTITNVFGANEVVPKSLDLARDTTDLPAWMSGISSYSIWWLLIHRDWYYYTGDKAYLEQQKTYMTALLKQLLSKVDAEGIECLDGNRFLDWPSNANPVAIHAGLQALMVMAMDAGAELSEILGDQQLSKDCRAMYEKMKAAAPKVSKLYFEQGKAPHEPGTKQGAALLVLADLMDPVKADKEILSVSGARGFSTFYGYYMLQAMAKAGNYNGAMQIIRDFWGAMLDLGATSFWEDFNVDWLPNAAPIDEIVPEGKKDIHGDYGAYCYVGFRHSLCHGWASGPTSWLTEHVLGVKVIEPACRVVRIKPHLGDLDWVEGKFPTPFGDIEISHRKGADGKIISKIKAPKGVKVVSR